MWRRTGPSADHVPEQKRGEVERQRRPPEVYPVPDRSRDERREARQHECEDEQDGPEHGYFPFLMTDRHAGESSDLCACRHAIMLGRRGSLGPRDTENHGKGERHEDQDDNPSWPRLCRWDRRPYHGVGHSAAVTAIAASSPTLALFIMSARLLDVGFRQNRSPYSLTLAIRSFRSPDALATQAMAVAPAFSFWMVGHASRTTSSIDMALELTSRTISRAR